MSTDDFLKIFYDPSSASGQPFANWDLQIAWILIAVGMVYLLLVADPIRRRFFPQSTPVAEYRKALFVLGLMVYYLAAGSPITWLAMRMFSMHMLEMSLFYFMMPPLLVLGIPDYLWRPVINIPVFKQIHAFLTRPLISLFFFNAMISIYHVPVVFDTIMNNSNLHMISHALLLYGSLCMWWPIICPVPEADRLKPLLKLALIFSNGILLTPACALITFTDDPLFNTYSTLSAYAPYFIQSAIMDQQVGGVIMKVTQEAVYITAIAIVLARWFKQERANDEQELLDWQNSQPSTTQNNG